MIYQIELDALAERKLKKLPKEVREEVYTTFSVLENNPRPQGCRKLTATSPVSWRVRLGRFRIIYTIDDTARHINVVDIDKRDKAYKKR